MTYRRQTRNRRPDQMTTISKVLVIDDDPIIREVLASQFKSRFGAECLIAADGKSALNLVKDHKSSLDLITTDINMPDCDGIEFLLSLNQCDCRIPIVVITGASSIVKKSAEALATSYGLNLLALLPKPVDYSQLFNVLTVQAVKAS